MEYTGVNDSCERRQGGGHYDSWGWSERGVVVIGVGPSGRPGAGSDALDGESVLGHRLITFP